MHLSLSHITYTLKHHLIGVGLLSISLVQIALGIAKVGYLTDYFAYTGAVLAWLAGINPYHLEYSNPIGVVNFLYPPAALFMFLPLAVLPPLIGQIVFTLISAGFFMLGIVLTVKLIENLGVSYALLATALLLQTFPAKFNLVLGQVNLIIVGLVVFTLYFLKRRQTVAAAVAFTLAVNLKLLPLVLLPVFLKHRLTRFVALSVTFILTSNLVFPHLSRTYLTQVLPAQFTGTVGIPDPYNQSLAATFYRLTQTPVSSGVTLVLFTAIITAIVLRRSTSLPTDAFNLLAVSAFFPANSWTHYLVFTYPFLLTQYFHPGWLFAVWFFLNFYVKNPHHDALGHIAAVLFQTVVLLALILYRTFNTLNGQPKHQSTAKLPLSK
jgi:hypothetical protein